MQMERRQPPGEEKTTASGTTWELEISWIGKLIAARYFQGSLNSISLKNTFVRLSLRSLLK
jgi:hypothetical protein